MESSTTSNYKLFSKRTQRSSKTHVQGQSLELIEITQKQQGTRKNRQKIVQIPRNPTRKKTDDVTKELSHLLQKDIMKQSSHINPQIPVQKVHSNPVKKLIQISNVKANSSLSAYKHIAMVDLSNNGQLIKDYLESEGFNVSVSKPSKSDPKFFFKWCWTPKSIDYNIFSEGNQLVNHISNIDILTTKTGLLDTFKKFEEDSKFLKMHSSSFFPETYILNLKSAKYSKDEKEFMEVRNEGIWIHKPWNLNCGGGISMVSNIVKFKKELKYLKSDSEWIQQGNQYYSEYFNENCMKSIIQKYVDKPLLINQKKFDIRCYILVVSTKPLFVVFSHGYLRLSMNEYNNGIQLNHSYDNIDQIESDTNKFTHLTNAAVQRYHPLYEQQKEDTIWSMEQFEEFLKQTYKKDGKFIEEIYDSIKRSLSYTVHACQDQIDKKLGCFELIGCDMLLDQNFRPYLIELNTNPALDVDTQVKQKIIPSLIQNSLKLLLNVYQNPLQIMNKLKNQDPNQFSDSIFDILINEATGYSYIDYYQELQRIWNQI